MVQSRGWRHDLGTPKKSSTHKHLPDFARALGTQALGHVTVGKAGNVLLALLDNHEREGSNVGADDAAADRLALPLSSTAGAVARVALGQQQLDTLRRQDTLLHGEALLVVAAHDFHDVALVLVAKGVGRDLGRNPLVVKDAAESRTQQ